jgi:hypothetical protein
LKTAAERRLRDGNRQGDPPPTRCRGVVPWLLLFGGALLAIALEARLRATRRRELPAAQVYAAQLIWVQYVMVGLGGFRGVIAETLWLRAGWLQEQGRYFEQVQLAEWITALDPRATDAWVFNAWNLAYNISAMMPRHADRVAWVAAGVSLLRDRALAANPHEARLYRELGWLYQNKIGDDTDPAHMLYKLSLARAMSGPLGAGGAPPPAGSAAAAELRASWRMEAGRMREFEARFGALDWRLAESHAIYWAWSGLEHARGFEIMACRRMIQQNLAASILRGTLTDDPEEEDGRVAFAPRLALIEPAIGFYAESVQLFPGERHTFAIFLAFALRQRHLAGDESGARDVYARLEDLAGTAFSIPDYATLCAREFPGVDFFQPRGGAVIDR